MPTNEKMNFTLPEITFIYKKKNLSEILNSRKDQELGNLLKLRNQSAAVNDLFDHVNIKLVFMIW